MERRRWGSGIVALFVSPDAVKGCVLIGALLMGVLAVIGGVQGNRAAGR